MFIIDIAYVFLRISIVTIIYLKGPGYWFRPRPKKTQGRPWLAWVGEREVGDGSVGRRRRRAAAERRERVGWEVGLAARQQVGDYGPAASAGLVASVAFRQLGIGLGAVVGAGDEVRVEAGGGEDGSWQGVSAWPCDEREQGGGRGGEGAEENDAECDQQSAVATCHIPDTEHILPVPVKQSCVPNGPFGASRLKLYQAFRLGNGVAGRKTHTCAHLYILHVLDRQGQRPRGTEKKCTQIIFFLTR